MSFVKKLISLDLKDSVLDLSMYNIIHLYNKSQAVREGQKSITQRNNRFMCNQ